MAGDGGDPAALDDLTAGDASLAAVARAVDDHLSATEDRPLTADANRWLGEATAVAGQAADAADDGAESVVRERLERVAELLAEVDATGDDAADARVERARALLAGAPD
jgi:hypothetical protein